MGDAFSYLRLISHIRSKQALNLHNLSHPLINSPQYAILEAYMYMKYYILN